ncbi:MAG: hypothetical protein H0U84_09890 [Thermoleophilaceae bacterium]|nr:hypothetical protein [Thermoleophilaceae bacterium]
MTHVDRCSWCDRQVEPDDCWLLQEAPGARRAAFCRLEHVVPWAMRGARWDPDGAGDSPEPTAGGECAHCGAALGEVRLDLVRHRGRHRISDSFCSVDHLAAWARAGGRWR